MTALAATPLDGVIVGLSIRLAVDIGGTFVDAITFDRESRALRIEKAPTTPETPATGVFRSIAKVDAQLSATEAFVHGTTLGINALLERKGGATGIITNLGFRDIYEIGRTNLPPHAMYDIHYQRRGSLVPRRRRLGVPGRLDPDGRVVQPLDEGAVVRAAEYLVEEEEVTAIAICFLHSYRNPKTERRAAEVVRSRYPDVCISVSSDIAREYREYERTSTVVLDAYIKPIFESYLKDLNQGLREGGFQGRFLVTRSGGGAVSWENAKRAPVHTILSGPAGGLIGAAHVARIIGRPNLIALDLGGTSLDACVVIDGSPAVEYEASLEHLPIMIPVYDIRTIGAGGGSIAWRDGELLKVGPRSAGADPGPICYGLGGKEPTVTDAALVLGYLDPQRFLGGEMPLDSAAALEGIREKLADPMGITVTDAARGVIDVTVARIVGSVREITVERGLDPRDFSILAYGGAGPMILPLLSRHIAAAEVIVPQAPSVFSAWGMLMADVVFDFSQTFVTLLNDLAFEDLDGMYTELRARADVQLGRDGFDRTARRFEHVAEMRYFGQEHTVPVPADELESLEELADRFRQQHLRRYGHTMDDPPQLVHLRLRGVGVIDKPVLQRFAGPTVGGQARERSREAYCFTRRRMVEFGVYRRDRLREREETTGPAVIQEETTTIVIQSDQRATIDGFGQIIITEDVPS